MRRIVHESSQDDLGLPAIAEESSSYSSSSSTNLESDTLSRTGRNCLENEEYALVLASSSKQRFNQGRHIRLGDEIYGVLNEQKEMKRDFRKFIKKFFDAKKGFSKLFKRLNHRERCGHCYTLNNEQTRRPVRITIESVRKKPLLDLEESRVILQTEQLQTVDLVAEKEHVDLATTHTSDSTRLGSASNPAAFDTTCKAQVDVDRNPEKNCQVSNGAKDNLFNRASSSTARQLDTGAKRWEHWQKRCSDSSTGLDPFRNEFEEDHEALEFFGKLANLCNLPEVDELGLLIEKKIINLRE